MAGEETKVRAPVAFHYIEDSDDLEKLGVIHAKLEAIASAFSTYRDRNLNMEQTAAVYGYWYILSEICDDIAAIIKLDYWTGEVNRDTEHTARPRKKQEGKQP